MARSNPGGGKGRPTGARIDHRGTGRRASGDLRGSKPAPKKKDWFTAPPTRGTRVDKNLFRPAPKRAARPASRRKGSFGGSGVNALLFNPKFAKPIMAKYVRQENAQQRQRVIEAVTAKPAPKPKPAPKYVRAPKIAPADQIVVPGGRATARRIIARPRLAAPRMVDPLSKGAKREARKNERQVVKRRDAVIAKDLKALVENRKSPKTVNRSVQRLRDYGVLSGKSRSGLARSIAGERDRQNRVAAERKRLSGTQGGQTSLERAVSKGAKAAVKFVTADPNALPGVEQARKNGQPVKVAGVDLTKVDKALQNSRSSTAAAALVAVEQLTRISSAEGEALSRAIRAAKSGKGSVPGAYLKGLVRGAVDNKSGYAKPLQDVGVSRGAAAGIGLVADILLDPTTYVSFGAVGAAKAAVRGAGAAAARAAVKQGLGREAVRAATKRAMRAKAVELRRGSASVRDLAAKGESAAVTAQRRELARLEAAGKGATKKAENIRRNVAPAGKRTESRIRKVERRTDVAAKRADRVAGRVAPDRTVSRVVNGKTVEVSVPGRVTVKPSRRKVTPIGPRFKQRKELRFANAEVRARFGGMAENQAIKGSKRQTVVNDTSALERDVKIAKEQADAEAQAAIAAEKAMNRRVVPSREYDPSAEGINSRPFYHGSGKPLKRKDLDGMFGTETALFGKGFYLTDNPDVAKGYAKSKGKKSGKKVLHEAELKVKKPLDIEGPLNKDWAELIVKFARQVDEIDPDVGFSLFDEGLSAGDSLAALAKKSGTTNESLYRSFKELLSNGYSSSDANELLIDFQMALMKRGYDALVHKGGGRVGKTRHQVVILLGPKGVSTRYGRNRAGKWPATEPNAIRRIKPVGGRISEDRAADVAAASGRTDARVNAARLEAQLNATPKTSARIVGTPADELKGTVYSIGFGKRARVKLRTSGTGFKSGSGIPGAKGLRSAVSEVAPGVRKSADVPPLAYEAARVAGRRLRAGDQAARTAGIEMDRLLSREGIVLKGDEGATWAAIYERSGAKSKEPLRKLDDGSIVYGSKADPVVVSDAFVKRHIDVSGARPVLKGADRVAERLAGTVKGVRRSGQEVGDSVKMRASVKDVAAKEGVSEKEAEAMLKAAKPEYFASGKRKPDPFAAATYLDNAATKFYPRRQALDKREQVRSDREELIPTNRGNLKARVDPRPLDVGNAERAARPNSAEAQSKPLISNDPNTDLPAYAIKMRKVEAYSDAVKVLADSGTSVKFKPGEGLDSFVERYRLPLEGDAVDGRKVYQIATRDGRYDLREVDTGDLAMLTRNPALGKGQYVVLDNRAVAYFHEARSSVVLSGYAGVRLYDQVSARIRRLAIFTPMYQAINEMGDTWIMFSLVPAYKIPYYKARALPIVRYIQGLESGKGAKALVGEGRKRGLGFLGDVTVFENGVERTVKEIADEIIGQGGARQGVLARSIDITDPQVRAATRDSRSRRAYRKVADSQMVAAGKMKIAPFNNVNPGSINRLAKSREDWSRTATYLYLRDEGFTPTDSASKMLGALIDYGELSKIERVAARRLAFFYTFPARQIPYQTKALIERPGKLAAYEKLRFAAAEAQGVNLDDLRDQPWYVQANVPIPVKIKGELYWVSGNLPFNMLNQTVPAGVNSGLKIIRNDALFAITSLNPIPRVFVEDIADRNFFFRSTITKNYGDNLTSAPSWAVWLANAVPGFAERVRLVKKPTKYSNGQDVWLMDNKWAWRFSQLAYGPLRLVGEAGKFRNQRGDTAAQRYGRFFTGIRTDSDKKKLEEARTRLYDKKDKLDQQVSTNRNGNREGTPADVRLRARVKAIRKLIDALNVELGIDPEFGTSKKSPLDKLLGQGSTDSGAALDKLLGKGATDNGSALDKLLGR